MTDSLLQRISDDLLVSTTVIKSIVDESNYLYKTYAIPKRDGGLRVIQQLTPELKALQYWDADNVLALFPTSRCAKGYKKGASIKGNAVPHIGAEYLFHTDIKNFFLQ